ncbi:hypothetical protein HF086_013974 [Spodoptera exigua]|uniref:Uncharacterized protein n=1 Tax=Spodoptera exigua TaxID=7107 RepID=A0A922SHN0_SPOEX|nr:hypothetical protein HF086_013974 [Spodoptera exigua]
MGCVFSLIKTSVIFGAGLYTGVYVAQNYKIDKVEDPKVLFERAQAYLKDKLAEASDKKDK